MVLSRRHALAAAASAALASPAIVRAQGSPATTPVRIGEISDYTTEPGVAVPYRKGWELALSHINTLGGLNGRPVEFVSRDDGGDPARAVQHATDLVHNQGVVLLAGGSGSAGGLALSQYALQNRVTYIAGLPLTDQLVWGRGNPYTYHVRPSAFMVAAMLVEAVFPTPARRWVSVIPATDDGRAVEQWFRKLLTARQPGTSFADAIIAPSPIDAAGLRGRIAQTETDAVFCALTGPDLLALVRQGGTDSVFGTRLVAALGAGDPETLIPMGASAPAGWFVTGYPANLSDEPFNKQFALDYLQQYQQPPTMGAAIGAALATACVSGILKAGSTEGAALAAGFAGAGFVTPFGICSFRAVDHQSTMGGYVGRLAVIGGQGVMTAWRYIDGAALMPPDAEIRALRPS